MKLPRFTKNVHATYSATGQREHSVSTKCNEPGVQDIGYLRMLGNRSVVQAKLKVGSADDEYEREADRVAGQVVHMQVSPVFRGISRQEMNLQRKCTACEQEKEPSIRRKPQSGGAGDNAMTGSRSVSDLLPGNGRPLQESERNFFEPRFGSDFSAVRIHDDSAAARSARALHAKAFTVGNHIAFAAGKFQPESISGRRLLAHELTHVVQQSMPGGWSAGSGETEAEAKAAGNRINSGQHVDVSHAAQSGQLQLDPDDSGEGEIQVIPKENGRIAVVLVKNGKIVQGYAEITPPKGMSAQEAAAKIGIGDIRTGGRPQVDVLLPSGWGSQAVNKQARVRVLDQGALQRQHQQEQQDKASHQMRTEMLQFFRWLDRQKGTELAEQHAVNLRTMDYNGLFEYRQKYLSGADYAAFIDAQNRARREAAIRSQMSPQELEAGFTVEDVKELHDPTPDLPPVLPEVSGRWGTRYTTEAETGLRYSKKLRQNGETYGYYQRWHVYIKGKGLHLREVYLDLDGRILKKQDRKIPATHETVIDLTIGVVPVVGDAVEIAELNYIAATGRDKWGNPVSDAEFYMRVAAVAVPGAITGAIARKAAAKELAQRTGRAMADEAEFLAEQARARKLAEGAQSPVLEPPPSPRVDVPAEQPSVILNPRPPPEPLAFKYPTPARYAVALDQVNAPRPKPLSAAPKDFDKAVQPLPPRMQKTSPAGASGSGTVDPALAARIKEVESNIAAVRSRQRVLRGGDIELPTGHPNWLEVQALERKVADLKQELRTLELQASGLPAKQAERWALHERVVTSNLRQVYGADKVAVQPKLEVVLSDGRVLEIVPDNLLQTGPRRFRVVDAKWTDAGDLKSSGVKGSLNGNQPLVYPELASGKTKSVSFKSTEDAKRFGIKADEPIQIESRVTIHTNRPGGKLIELTL